MSAYGRNSVWREAARYGDADAEEHGLMATLERQGIDVAEFQHVAEQRALRVVLQQRPGHIPRALSDVLPAAVRLSPREKGLHTVLTAAYFDGLYIGWRARGLAQDTPAKEGETT